MFEAIEVVEVVRDVRRCDGVESVDVGEQSGRVDVIGTVEAEVLRTDLASQIAECVVGTGMGHTDPEGRRRQDSQNHKRFHWRSPGWSSAAGFTTLIGWPSAYAMIWS